MSKNKTSKGTDREFHKDLSCKKGGLWDLEVTLIPRPCYAPMSTTSEPTHSYFHISRCYCLALSDRKYTFIGHWTKKKDIHWTTENRPIHAFNKSGRHLEFLIYDVIRGKTSAAIFEFWLAWQYHVRTRGKVRPLWIALFHSFPV